VILTLLLYVLLMGKPVIAQSDDYFKSVVQEISNVIGIAPDFEIVRIHDPSKCAAFVRATLNGKRKIHVNDAATGLNPELRGEWPWRFIIAHEIGHFQNGHVFTSINSVPEALLNGMTPKRRELEADLFAGYVLGLMGATEDQVVSAFPLIGILPNTCTTEHSSDYPPNDERYSQARAGWRMAKDRIMACAAVFSTTGQGNANALAVSSTCETDDTGDYCFQNSTASEIAIEVSYRGSRLKQALVKPGQTKCLFSMTSNVYYFTANDHVTNERIDYGDIIVERCKSKSYVIN